MESSRKLSEIKDLHDKIRQSAEEAKKKEGLYKQLVCVFRYYIYFSVLLALNKMYVWHDILWKP